MTIEAPLDPFAEVVDERRKWRPDWYSWLARLVAATNTADVASMAAAVAATPLAPCLVAALPPPTTPSQRGFVTDATVDTFGTVVVGVGAISVPVYADGVDWRIG